MNKYPTVSYKKDLRMQDPVTVTLPAADWAILMAWFSGHIEEELNGIKHIVFTQLAGELAEKLFDKPSLKAAHALHNEKTEEVQLIPIELSQLKTILGETLRQLGEEEDEEKGDMS